MGESKVTERGTGGRTGGLCRMEREGRRRGRFWPLPSFLHRLYWDLQE